MINAKEQLWDLYKEKRISSEALYAGLKLIDSKCAYIAYLKDSEINVIVKIANSNLGLVTGNKKYICLHIRNKDF